MINNEQIGRRGSVRLSDGINVFLHCNFRRGLGQTNQLLATARADFEDSLAFRESSSHYLLAIFAAIYQLEGVDSTMRKFTINMEIVGCPKDSNVSLNQYCLIPSPFLSISPGLVKAEIILS